MWQDWLLSVAVWVLLFAMIPTLISKTEKPALLTSLITGSALAIIAFVYATLSLWWSAVPTALISASWFVLAYQRYRLDTSQI